MSNPDSPSSIPVLFVGIDWASKKHDLCWIAADGRTESHTFEHEEPKIRKMLELLEQAAQGGPIAIALEKSRGPLQRLLEAQPGIQLYLIDPKQFDHYRRSFVSSTAKADLSDARRLAQMVKERYQELKRFEPSDPATRRIGLLSETRRKLVDQKTAIIQQLTQLLRGYYPLALELGSPERVLVRTVLRRWPDPTQFRRAHPEMLRELLRKYRFGNAEEIEAMILKIRQDKPIGGDPLVTESSIFQLQAGLGQLKVLFSQIKKIDQTIQIAMAQHPDVNLFKGIRGAGPSLTPRLLAALGSDRQRYKSAEELMVVAGIAPVTRQSGNSKTVRSRVATSKFLRQTFHEFAASTCRQKGWANLFYKAYRAAGMAHHAAVRKIAAKWIRILFKVWKDRVQYDETRYLDALKKKNPNLSILSPANP